MKKFSFAAAVLLLVCSVTQPIFSQPIPPVPKTSFFVPVLPNATRLLLGPIQDPTIQLSLSWQVPTMPNSNVIISAYSSSSITKPFSQWNLIYSETNSSTRSLMVDNAAEAKFFVVLGQFYDLVYLPTPLPLWWTPSTSSNIVNYLIYSGPVSGGYSNRLSIPNTNTTIVPEVTNKTFFAATALDGWAGESPFSNELVYSPPTAMTNVVTKSLQVKLARLPNLASWFFTNSTAITIRDNTNSLPYPSLITVNGVVGTVTNITISLGALTHTRPADIDMLLVGPLGQKVVLMSDCGSKETIPTSDYSITNIVLSFTGKATNSLLQLARIATGSYKPTNYGTNDTFLSPAPPAPYTNTLSVFNNSNVNGPWLLYIMDDRANRTGTLQGWSINIGTTNP